MAAGECVVRCHLDCLCVGVLCIFFIGATAQTLAIVRKEVFDTEEKKCITITPAWKGGNIPSFILSFRVVLVFPRQKPKALR